MAQKEKELFNREIRVILTGGIKDYEVYEKPIPQKLKNHPDYNKYEWIGNFGLKDPNGNEVSGRVPTPYILQVARRPNKNKLVYWDGSNILELTGNDVRVGNRDYRAANLDLGDPPTAWG